jgi:hypothetical protein
MEAYTLIEGVRASTLMYATEGGHGYTAAGKPSTSGLPLRCCKLTSHACPGKAVAFTLTETLQVKCAHNHEPDLEMINERRFRADLKKAVAWKDDDVVKIYEEVAAKYPSNIRERVPFKSIASGLYKKRKKCPETPDNCRACKKKKSPAFAIFPCSHTFCETCAKKAVEEGNCKDCKPGESPKPSKCFQYYL